MWVSQSVCLDRRARPSHCSGQCGGFALKPCDVVHFECSALAVIANGRDQRGGVGLLERGPEWVAALQASNCGKFDRPRLLVRIRRFAAKDTVLGVGRYLEGESCEHRVGFG